MANKTCERAGAHVGGLEREGGRGVGETAYAGDEVAMSPAMPFEQQL